MHKIDGKDCVIGYAYRVTNEYKTKYCTYDLEALALIFALKVWRCYLLG